MSERGKLRFFEPPPARDELRVRKTMDPIESYGDRDGYDPAFLGEGNRIVPLPDTGRFRADIALRNDTGGSLLDYRHFSVIFHRRRRLPILSAVNIDGNREQSGIPRTNIWKRDPRIDEGIQILEECYGGSEDGYFSRGHMTRREDPNWGNVQEATQADAEFGKFLKTTALHGRAAGTAFAFPLLAHGPCLPTQSGERQCPNSSVSSSRRQRWQRPSRPLHHRALRRAKIFKC